MDTKLESLIKAQNDILNFRLTTLINEVRALNPRHRTRAETNNPLAEIPLGPSTPTTLGKNDKSTYIVAKIGTKNVSGINLSPLDEFYGTKEQADERLKLFVVAYPSLTIKLLTAQEYFDLKNQNLSLANNATDNKRSEEEFTQMLTQLFNTILGPSPEDPKPSKLRDIKPSDFKDSWPKN